MRISLLQKGRMCDLDHWNPQVILLPDRHTNFALRGCLLQLSENHLVDLGTLVFLRNEGYPQALDQMMHTTILLNYSIKWDKTSTWINSKSPSWQPVSLHQQT